VSSTKLLYHGDKFPTLPPSAPIQTHDLPFSVSSTQSWELDCFYCTVILWKSSMFRIFTVKFLLQEISQFRDLFDLWCVQQLVETPHLEDVWSVDVQLHTFLNSALNRSVDSKSPSRLGVYTCRKVNIRHH